LEQPVSASELYGGRGIRIVSGQGVTVRDEEGREYLDFLCGHGAALFGHAHPDLRQALAEASASPWTIGMGLDAPARRGFLDLLASLLDGGEAYLANSGAEAIEAALKLVLLLRPRRPRILAARRGFHGRTLGALALTFNPHYRRPWKDALLPVEFHAVEELPGQVDERTAAVFIEPVQGEGGVFPLDGGVGRELSAACRKSGALLVADEIQSGWGRCGSLLASSLVGLDPDVVTLAKGIAGGLPAGAVVWKACHGGFPAMSHGSTYGGNPLVCAVALRGHEVILRDGLLERSAKVGSYLRSGISRLGHPGIVDVRGMGLLVGVEVRGRSAPVVRALQERGLLALPAGPQVVRFLPPLTAGEADCDRAVDILAAALNEAE